MLVQPQRLRRAEQHDAAEHVPLDLEPAVGRVAEQVADGGVAGADQAGQQHQPFGNEAGDIADGVDDAGQFEQKLHLSVPGVSPSLM